MRQSRLQFLLQQNIRAQIDTLFGLQELESIAVGPRHIDFGRVRISAMEARYISVSNPLRRHLHIVLATDRLPELALTEPVSQVKMLQIMGQLYSLLPMLVSWHLQQLFLWPSQQHQSFSLLTMTGHPAVQKQHQTASRVLSMRASNVLSPADMQQRH